MLLFHASILALALVTGAQNLNGGGRHPKVITLSDSTDTALNLECVLEKAGVVVCDGEQYSAQQFARPPSFEFYLYIAIALVLICTAGLMSGLQLGLLSLSTNALQILSNAGKESQKAAVKKISPLVHRRHLLLVALLIANAACLETLPLFLDELMGHVMNIVVSVTAVLFFGEIIPQAVCVRFGLAIGSAMSWLVWGIIGVTLPISWPISKLLDTILGETESHFFRRAELKALMNLHEAQGVGETKLSVDEANVIGGALEMTSKTVACCMTPLKDAFMLEQHTVINHCTVQCIQATGRSRIPIYDEDRNCIKGMLLAKRLLGVDLTAGLTVRSMMQPMPSIYVGKLLIDCLREFREEQVHIAAVHNVDNPAIVDGIVTLEDIFEQLLGEEIMDEMDIRHASESAPSQKRALGRLVGMRVCSGHHGLPTALEVCASSSQTSPQKKGFPGSLSRSVRPS
eukprot:EG_transcript_11245